MRPRQGIHQPCLINTYPKPAPYNRYQTNPACYQATYKIYKGQLPGVNTDCATIAKESKQIDSQASISISEGDRVHDYYIGDQMK